ncbi:MAG: hypothetical protein AAFV32_02590 [Myxococcota bacterium]
MKRRSGYFVALAGAFLLGLSVTIFVARMVSPGSQTSTRSIGYEVSVPRAPTVEC